jgi:transposase
VVAIDASKFFHRILLADCSGKVLRQPFSIDIYRQGFQKLIDAVLEVQKEIDGKLILVGIESTGHYHENLVRKLRQRVFCEVLLINPFSTNEMRNLNLNYVKTDDCDLDAIAELVILCKATPANLPEGVYLQLRELARWRRGKVDARASLKQQIHGHMDRIWPGIVNYHEKHKGISQDFWCKTVRFLVEQCLGPQQVLELGVDGLRRLAEEAQGPRIGRKMAQRIIDHAQASLCPDPETIEVRRRLLLFDVSQLKVMEDAIAEAEAEMERLLAQCPGRFLLSIPGVGVITAAEIAGELGPPEAYVNSSAAGKLAGLNPGTYQTGVQESGRNKITKFGRPTLRRTAVDAARRLLKYSYFSRFYDRLLARAKHKNAALCAVARKFLSICLALMRDQKVFDPPTARKKGLQAPSVSPIDKGAPLALTH